MRFESLDYLKYPYLYLNVKRPYNRRYTCVESGAISNINRNVLFKVYLTALFELNIDLTNRVPSSEVRMIRRIVRGDRFRGTHPEETMKQWENVRLGEYKNVFKFQEESDIMFNSSLLYELNAL